MGNGGAWGGGRPLAWVSGFRGSRFTRRREMGRMGCDGLPPAACCLLPADYRLLMAARWPLPADCWPLIAGR
jgi:hypothetical protein